MYTFKRGQTSVILRVKLLDSSVTTGAGLTGLTSGSSGLIVSTIADNESSATAYSGSNLESITTLGTFAAPTSGKCRFKEVDATNHKGLYEIQVADARFAVSNAKSLIVSISGATNLAQCDLLVRLTDADPYDAVRQGMTALPNVASGSAGAIITSGTGTAQLSVSSGQVILQTGTGTGQLDFTSGVVKANVTQFGGTNATTSGGRPEVNTTHVGGTSQTARDLGASVLLSPGTGTGQISLSSGGVTLADGVSHGGTLGSSTATLALSRLNVTSQSSNTAGVTIAGNGTGAGLSSTGGATGAAVKLVGGGTSGDGLLVTTTSGHGFSVTATGASKHGAIFTGGDSGTSDGVKAVAGTGGVPIRGDITGNVTGNLSGSVGSVTGAVGSVTGAVGSVTGNVGGNVTGSVGSIASGGITAASFAADSITAAAIATDAIGSAELAASAVSEISSAVSAAFPDTIGLTSDAFDAITVYTDAASPNRTVNARQALNACLVRLGHTSGLSVATAAATVTFAGPAVAAPSGTHGAWSIAVATDGNLTPTYTPPT